MNNDVITLCELLKEEADAVISYSSKLAATNNNDNVARLLEVIRLDEIEHLQELILELTKMISSIGKEGEDE